MIKSVFTAFLGVSLLICGPAQGDGVEPDVIAIPAGAFIRGSDRAEREAAYRLDEAAYGHSVTRDSRWYESEPERGTVQTGAYAITATLITNAQYAAFIDDTGYPAPVVSSETWCNYGLIHPYERTRRHVWRAGRPPRDREDHPVVLVSHDDATAYAAWLSRRTGMHGACRPRRNGKRRHAAPMAAVSRIGRSTTAPVSSWMVAPPRVNSTRSPSSR